MSGKYLLKGIGKIMKRNVRICVLAALMAVTVLFTGCSFLQTAQNKVVEKTLNAAVNGAIDAAVDGNEDISRVADEMQSNVELKVLSSSISEDGMTATCLVTAPDLTEFIGSFDINDYPNMEALCDAVIAAISDAPKTEKEITIGFQSTEDGYELLALDSFLNAYFGGGIDILEDLQDQSK